MKLLIKFLITCLVVNNISFADEVKVFDNYVGDGYGVPTKGMKEALKLMATKEAILLDPVYSGKAFDGLLDLVSKKYFKNTDKLLFIHTGGSVSLYAYEWAFGPLWTHITDYI